MIVDSILKIPYGEMTPKEMRKLKSKLTFTPDGANVVECFRDAEIAGHLKVPRGAWNLVGLDYHDKRSKPLQPSFEFTHELDAVDKDERFKGQSECVEAMLEYEQGVILRPPGTGKSQIALAFAATCETPTLVLVHTKDILDQWVQYSKTAVPEAEIGVIQGTNYSRGHITIATVQTMAKFISTKPSKWWRYWGAVIADEGHHGAAPTWEALLNTLPAFYRFGMTASETRADNMHPLIRFLIGPVIHRQKFTSPVKLQVKPVKTKFRTPYRGPFDWTPMVTKLVQDGNRNAKIARIINDEAEQGNSILVLSRRIEHLERIARSVKVNCEILTSKRKGEERRKILADFRDGSLQVVLATQLADEALDVPRLNRVLLTHPGKHEGRIIQQIGRAIRQHPDKQDAIIYDIVDARMGVLKRQWQQRKRAYRKARISIKSTGRLFKKKKRG